MKKILVTGTAGFIGFHLANLLLRKGYEVYGLDSINDYYDPALKYARLEQAGIDPASVAAGKEVKSTLYPSYTFTQVHLENKSIIDDIFSKHSFDAVVNLAAQAGVRYSIENPHAYINANINGFINILEACRHKQVKHLIYASTSSVYGLNKTLPLSEHDHADHPMTLYAATKKANEMMAHCYSHLFGLPTTGLRFFTVYGPWGRPDMALFLFAKAIMNDEPIKLFNEGKMVRDFTYVEDVAESISRLLDKPPVNHNHSFDPSHPDPAISSAPFRILNIGNSKPVQLMRYVEALEKTLGKKAIKEYLPMQLGDVPATHADCSELESITGYKPEVEVEQGIAAFVEWYKSYHKVSLSSAH